MTLLAQSRPTPAGLSASATSSASGGTRTAAAGAPATPTGRRAIDRAMAVTGVDGRWPTAPSTSCPAAQLQRVWLASCLAQDTGVLLLDEPTTFLDLRYQVEILDLVRDLADDHGVAVGVVLHDLDQAAAVADQLVLLDEGRVRVVRPAGRGAHAPSCSPRSTASGSRWTTTRAPARLRTRPVGPAPTPVPHTHRTERNPMTSRPRAALGALTGAAGRAARARCGTTEPPAAPAPPPGPRRHAPPTARSPSPTRAARR